MKKKFSVILLSMLLCFNIISVAGVGNSKKWTVTWPGYAVVINGETINNEELKYPILNYNGITYVPLTYNLARFMGIETNWSPQEGLSLLSTGISAEYAPEKLSQSRVRPKVTVEALTFPVDLEEPLDTDYPLFMYNGIVYLPLTYEYCGDLNLQLQYETAVEESTGKSQSVLTIETSNPKVNLVKDMNGILNREGYGNSAIIRMEGVYFINDNQGVFFRSFDADKANEVFELPEDTAFSGLALKGDKVVLTYHVGGAIMGSDFTYELNPDGTSRLISDSYEVVHEFETFNIKYWGGPMPSPSNLSILRDLSKGYDDSHYERIGDPEVQFGWVWSTTGGGEGGSPGNPIYAVGDNLYLVGVNRTSSKYSTLYRLNYKTGETESLIERHVSGIRKEGDYIYYSAVEDGWTTHINRYNILTGKDEVIKKTDEKIASFEVLNGVVYFLDDSLAIYKVSEETDGIAELFIENQPQSSQGLKKIEGDKDYLVFLFDEALIVPYRIIVVDDKNQMVFKSSDATDMASVSIEGGKLSYLNRGTWDFCQVQLGEAASN